LIVYLFSSYFQPPSWCVLKNVPVSLQNPELLGWSRYDSPTDLPRSL